VWQQWTYEDGTRRLSKALAEREQAGNLRVDLLSYAYDPAGNVNSIKDELPGVTVDNQCLRYDYARRMTDAWTQTGDCAAFPSAAVVAGPAAYWHTYGYDVTGNRKSLTQHALGGVPEKLSTYTYPAAGQPRPHAVTAVAATGSGTASYEYNATGHTTSRPGPGGQQTLTWNAEGRLTSITSGENTTSYRYDADGTQLIRRDPTTVTVFVGDGELVYDTVNKTSRGTRYYRAGGRAIAVRTGGALRWLVDDHHGTNQFTVDPTTLQATVRRSDPFGNPRGVATNWLGGNRGFVGGTRDDATGLTRLGAREYDPSTGRFISVDPVMDLNDPQQMNGYAYANNNPASLSDPSGLQYFVDLDGLVTVPGAAAAKAMGQERYDAILKKAQQKAENIYGLGATCVNPDRDCRSTAQKTKDNAARPKPTFDFDYLKKHGVPDPDTDPSVYTRDTIDKIINMCAWVNGDADCDADFHGWAIDMHFKYLGYDGTVDFMVTEGFAGWEGGRGGRGARGGGGCGGKSFASDTPVLMADGTTKQIGDVQPGDQVLATDPETGDQSSETVTNVWVHNDELVDLQLGKPNGSGAVVTVTTTDDHRFWNDTDQQWQPASALDPGDRLRAADGNPTTVVGLLEHTRHEADAYNLTVSELHTYYVIVGTTPVLVHNAGPGGCAPFGNGGVRAPKAPSYRSTNAGTYKTRDQAWAAANRDTAKYRYSSPREECSSTKCHVHLDVYNNQGELLETRHYAYQER
jgi:RHS repeat-associated protein